MPPAEIFPRPLGRYTLLAPLAQGGMGALYLGCQGEGGLEKLCVIKTVLPQLADAEYLARFRDEAKVVVRLSHGNLVPVFDAGSAREGGRGEQLYLAMEHVEGKDLRAVWNRCAKLGIAFPVDVAVHIARELARGLHHAHTFAALQLVHRDVSPPNVLLSYGGEVKLTDFGLASSTMKKEKTAPGIIYGKVSYMSPEQARGEPLDGRTDQYAVGVMLWELLTGRQMFPQGEANLIDRVRAPAPAAPSSVAARVRPELDLVVVKAIQPDREARYPDCEELRAALAGFLARTAPTTDTARVAAFLRQLFGDEIEAERSERQRLLEARPRARPTPGSAATAAEDPAPGGEEAGEGPEGRDLVGTALDGRYLVKRVIGEGGMGLVFEAEHLEIGRRVAVKVLHQAFSRQPEVVARFRSEARAATRIGHPHIVDVFDSGTTSEGAVYLVMEHLEGCDLAQAIADEGTLPAARAIAITRQICLALSAAHKAGILHRDMKPENVFLVPREGQADFVKVLDFGIAKTLDQATGRVGRLTHPGVAMGTPEYMAPEQAAGATIDARADVYSVGAILYEMLSGRPPHEGANVMEVLSRKATVEPVPLGRLRPGLAQELERLVMRTLAASPADRPASMDALQEELQRISDLAARPTVEQRAITTDRLGPRRPALWAGAAAAAVAVLVTGLYVAGMAPGPRGRVGAKPALRRGARPGRAPRSVGSVSGPEAARSSATAAGSPRPAPTVVAPAPTVVAPAPPPVAPAAIAAPPAPRPRVAVDPPPPAPDRAQASARPVLAPVSTPRADPQRAAILSEAQRTLDEGRSALGAGRYAHAENLFAKVRSMGVLEGAAVTGLAETAFQRGRYPEATQLARRAIAAAGGVPAQLVLGNAYFKLGRYDEAIAQYQEILRRDRGHVEARSNLAAAQKRKGG